jgi:NAD(P)-dependent dehydrogenase (short-subunit alcohol dehydrogenase family)
MATIANKVAFVTGVSRGIGRAAAVARRSGSARHSPL